MSSRLRVDTKRFCLSAAVKITLVRFVSTRTTSSECSVVSSSGFAGGVGEGGGEFSARRGRLSFCGSVFCARDPATKTAAAGAMISRDNSAQRNSFEYDIPDPIISSSRYLRRLCNPSWYAASDYRVHWSALHPRGDSCRRIECSSVCK